MIKLLEGDCLYKLKELDDNSVDSIVTDPPYGISFMGKGWDKGVPSSEVWAECLRVLKPGGHLLCFAGTRTQHKMATNIEEAGFEIRDMIAWVYGSGFPKSHDVSKAIDKAAGAEREVAGYYESPENTTGWKGQDKRKVYGKSSLVDGEKRPITSPSTKDAEKWQGWGTALKPAMEPITVARKPLTGTVAANVLQHGTGAINVDACRVKYQDNKDEYHRKNTTQNHGIWDNCKNELNRNSNPQGRFPANLIHDGSDEVVRLFPVMHGRGNVKPKARRKGTAFFGNADYIEPGLNDSTGGSAARFFYCAKASKRDRNEGLPEGATSTHPTVKPTALMRYLVRLVTPPGGTVLDPYMGSGSTGKAAKLEGFSFIGIDKEAEYIEIAQARISAVIPQPELFT